jgi:hypothetical protein
MVGTVNVHQFLWDVATTTWVKQEAGGATTDTELPAAAALADAVANPTVPGVGANNLLFNGTTWDRVRGDITNGIDVDVTRVQGTVTVSGTVTANAGTGTLAVDTEMPAAAALADAAANPTTPLVGSPVLLFNGTTWDRVRGDITNGIDVDVTRVTGTVDVRDTRPATSTLTNVAASTVNVTLLASNANARIRTIYNDGTQDLYVKFGATASTTSFTVKIPSDGFYELPQPVYSGIVDGIWTTANGSARMTEVT